MRLRELFVHPVKSMRGNALDRAAVEARGLAGDRRWMVIDPSGRFVTGRQVGALAACAAEATATGLRLSFGGSVTDVPTPRRDAARSVVVWNDEVPALDAGDAVADWLSARFGRPLRLVYQADHQQRPLPPKHRVAADDEVSFADAYPLLAIGTASLDDLNTRLNAPVTMRHFRPNVVVQTDEAYAEDRWRNLRIGDAVFRSVSRCTRCVFTTVDPETGERRDDGEPLATLRGYRRDAENGRILFGVNLVPLSTGTLRVGDAVEAAD